MTKILMDGGSRLNIILPDTLRKMGIPLENLVKSENTFYDIVPGKAVYPKGTITLDVVFGTSEHFRKEMIDFDMVDWESQYHAI